MSSLLNSDLLGKTSKLLSILSKKDALTIFLLAKEGLKAETDTWQRIGLTRKRYYSRLRQLVDVGLLDKSADTYTHTTLGALVREKQLMELLEQVRNVKQMKMLDTLKRNQQFSEDDVAELFGNIVSTTSTKQASSEFVWSYEDMISRVVKDIESCEKEILFATRYLNEIIVRNTLRKVNSGINVKILGDSDHVNQYLAIESQCLSGTETQHTATANNANAPHRPNILSRRIMQVPFTVIILDGTRAAVELVNSVNPAKFQGFIFIKDELACKSLTNWYAKLWNSATEDMPDTMEVNVVDAREELVSTQSMGGDDVTKC